MINKVTLIGHLGGDPEIRHLETGNAVGRFSLATNENYKDKEGNWQSRTEWHNVVIWREDAERAEKYLKKGMLVFVEGKISYRKYTDKDGVERNTTDIVASTFRSMEKREGAGTNDSRFPATEPNGKSQSPMPTADVSVAAGGGDDDLPF